MPFTVLQCVNKDIIINIIIQCIQYKISLYHFKMLTLRMWFNNS